MTSAFIEALPSGADDVVGALVARGERVVMCVGTDLDHDLTFSSGWMVVTDRRIILYQPGQQRQSASIYLTEVTAAKVEPLVGGGRVALERDGCSPVYLYFSASLAQKFAEAAAGIEKLIRGEPLSLPDALDRIRCEICGRMLPEKNGSCPRCTKKRQTLR